MNLHGVEGVSRDDLTTTTQGRDQNKAKFGNARKYGQALG